MLHYTGVSLKRLPDLERRYAVVLGAYSVRLKLFRYNMKQLQVRVCVCVYAENAIMCIEQTTT